MRGGCWDAGQAVEEIADVVREWRHGSLTAESALEEIECVLYRTNFGELLESEEPPESDEGGVEEEA